MILKLFLNLVIANIFYFAQCLFCIFLYETGHFISIVKNELNSPADKLVKVILRFVCFCYQHMTGSFLLCFINSVNYKENKTSSPCERLKLQKRKPRLTDLFGCFFIHDVNSTIHTCCPLNGWDTFLQTDIYIYIFFTF